MRSIFAEESATYEDKEQVRKRRVVAPEWWRQSTRSIFAEERLTGSEEDGFLSA